MKLIAFFVAKDGEAIHSQQKQDLELWLISSASHSKIQLKLKKVGKTTRPARYNLQWR